MKKKKKNLNICFAASSGGHYEQLMRLEPLMKKYDSFVLTEKTLYKTKKKDKKNVLCFSNKQEREIFFV